MKKYILLVVSAVALAFTSCSDMEEIDIKYQVDLVVNPSSVLEPFHGFRIGGQNYGLDMYDKSDGKASLRISTYIYDNSGNRVDVYENLVDDYNSKVTIPISVRDNEEYTIVSISSSILGTLQSPTAQSFTISGSEKLSTLSILQQSINGIYSGNSFGTNWSILGASVRTITSENKGVVDINLSPITSMVKISYNNVHAWDEYAVDTYAVQYKNNSTATYSGNQFTFSTALSNGQVSYSDLDVTENSGNSIAEIINILPCENMEYNGLLFIGENRLDFVEANENGAGTVNIQSGLEYECKIDCAEWAIEFTQENSTRSINAEPTMLMNSIIIKNSLDNNTSLAKSKKKLPQSGVSIIELLNKKQ